MPRITLLPLLLTLSGCALVFQGANEHVTVNTLSNKDINDTSCTLANEEGRWDVKGNDLVVIHRDGNAMTITCANQRQSGSVVVEPLFHGEYLFFDLFSACLLCIPDATSNSFYDYPEQVNVIMCDSAAADGCRGKLAAPKKN